MMTLHIVMAGHSRPKDGVASLAYVPAIQSLMLQRNQDVDARDKRGHDGSEIGSIGMSPGMTMPGGVRR